MDLILEIIIKIAEFLSSTSWQVDESEIYSFLISEGYRKEDIKSALFWIRDAGSEARWRSFHSVKLYEVLERSGLPRKDWELFVNSLLSLYEDTEVERKEVEDFAKEFARSAGGKGFFFVLPEYQSEN